jgi:hypothetical protein
MKNKRRARNTFIALCVLSSLGLTAYFYRTATRVSPPTDAAIGAPGRSPRLPGPMLFRHTAVDRNYGKLAVLGGDGSSGLRLIDDLLCEVVSFAGGRGICLTADRGVFTSYAAHLFDASFVRRQTIPLNGVPSRCRMSPDGRLAAFTVFLSGHGYASLDFSTETLLADAETGAVLANLEEFAVSRDGQPFRAADFNFWGVTFAPDSRRFYCTLSSDRRHYLVEGDAIARTARVIHENVECPSVSPDGTRIAYKKRVLEEGRVGWELHVLDLATRQDTALSETRSVDDQLEWLDNARVLYALSASPSGVSASTDVWEADAAGRTPPRLFLPNAYSPAVVR